eukprot:gene35771-48105_t
MAQIHRATCSGKSWANKNCHYGQSICKSFRNWADVTLIRAVEGRAVLEHKLLAALCLQPLKRLQRKADSFGCRDGAGFQ